MEKYVISFEQAKKLHELGAHRFVEVELQYYWLKPSDIWEQAPYLVSYHNNHNTTPAYHVGELGEILGQPWLETVSKGDNGVWRGYEYHNDHRYSYYPTEAQARGAILIYLIENGML